MSACRYRRQQINPEQRQRLLASAHGGVPDGSAVLALTAEIDESAKGRGQCFAMRIMHFLESVQQFSAVVDTFVSSSPRIAALVWGSVKFALLVCSSVIIMNTDDSSFLTAGCLCLWLLRQTVSSPHGPQKLLSPYILPNTRHFTPALWGCKMLCAAFYATVASFCGKVIGVIQRSGTSGGIVVSRSTGDLMLLLQRSPIW